METHTKKHILGFVGLAAVAAMTAVAYTIPTPDASAVAAQSAEVTYSVEVHEKASVTFTDGLDGAVFTETPISISAKYGEIIKIAYFLSYTDYNGDQVTERLIRSYCPASSDGSCPEDAPLLRLRSARSAPASTSDYYITGTDTFDLDFNQYGGYGTYTLHVVVTTTQSTDEDYATFTYAPGAPAEQGTDENGNPIIDVKVNDDVKYADIQVYDEDGNPLFVDENGNPKPIRVEVDENGHIITPLPFDEYDIANGKYRIEFTFYDENGNVIGTYTMDYNYGAADQRVNSLAVPDTGFLGLGNLNFSNPDYWIAGLAGLTALAGGAYYLSKRAKSRR